MKTICFFGIYKPEYSRNRILMDGLRQNSFKVIECRTTKTGFKKYLDLIRKHRQLKNSYDVLLVAFPGYQSMILARFLTSKKIIFDAFTSTYDSEVYDRKKVRRRSFLAVYYFLLDWLSCRLANKVLLDTDEHIKYFMSEFRLRREKFEKVLVGVSDIFLQQLQPPRKDGKCIVYFHGSNIPLQGIPYILEAAHLLINWPEIKFILIGPGIDRGCKFILPNTTFFEKVPYEDLPRIIDKADICLGIFGNTAKTQRVIPNKVYECVARGRCVITADTPAIRELFTANDMYLVPAANAQMLADAIVDLWKNTNTQTRFINNSRSVLLKYATPQIIGKQMKEIINKL